MCHPHKKISPYTLIRCSLLSMETDPLLPLPNSSSTIRPLPQPHVKLLLVVIFPNVFETRLPDVG